MICSKLHNPVTDASDANTDTVEVWGAQTHVDILFSPPAFFSLRNADFPRKARPLLSHQPTTSGATIENMVNP
jgi:hypothetical protein